MPLTRDEYEEVVKLSCRHCAAGNEPRWREETREYVHDVTRPLPNGGIVSHSFCLATGIRRAYQEGKLNG